MDPILEIYEDVGRGRVPAPVDYNEYKRLLAKARKATSAEDEGERLLAVDVGAAVGRDRGMGVVRLFLKDPSPAVRRHCIEKAVEGGEHGIMVLRHAIEDEDPEVVALALPWLRRALDPGCAGALRKVLRRSEPELRAQAAELIGHVAGPGLVIALRSLLDDPEPEVAEAAREAIDRLDGKLAKDEPDPWWDLEEDEHYIAVEGEDLPQEWPEDPLELIRLLGRIKADHIDEVVAHLEPMGPSKMGFVVRKARPNGDRALNIGAARLGKAWARGDWVVPLRRLLPDDDPGVRIAVAECLAEIGGATVLTGLAQLLDAHQPEVRAAAVRALANLCGPAELSRWLKALGDEQDPDVLHAVATAGVSL
ncbi:MAG: HEAT repeat domain-containing protein [Deltaproteobacteria bacterium]|nr:MAG: HEAT repeat domain-containing protein [Deltaproteobacteria bacterium]